MRQKEDFRKDAQLPTVSKYCGWDKLEVGWNLLTNFDILSSQMERNCQTEHGVVIRQKVLHETI